MLTLKNILAFIIGVVFGLLIGDDFVDIYKNNLDSCFKSVNNFGVYLVDDKDIFSYFKLHTPGRKLITGILGIGAINVCFSCLSEQREIITEEIKRVGKDVKLGFIIGIKMDNDKVLLRNFFLSDTTVLWFSVSDSVINSFLGLNFSKEFSTFIYCAVKENKLVSYYIPVDDHTHFRAWIRKALIYISQ